MSKEIIMTNMDLTIVNYKLGEHITNSVNARDLYKALEIGKDFTNWIKAQIKTLGLEKNIDFDILSEDDEILFALKGEKSDKTGRPEKNYIITTETAKHIAMASRTQKGKEVRNYFINIEKSYRKVVNTVLSQNFPFTMNTISKIDIAKNIIAYAKEKNQPVKYTDTTVTMFIDNFIKQNTTEIVSPNILYKIYVVFSTVNGVEAIDFDIFVGQVVLQGYDLVRYKQGNEVVKAFRIGGKEN